MQMPHWPIPPFRAIKYDLKNITSLLAALNSPHLHIPPVIHVAGTNGKGSTVAFLRSIFTAAKYKVHCYTSPHLIQVNERIILAGECITDEYLFEICERTRLVAEASGITPTFFEGITAASFLAFAEIPADILILETGMGGRLDATNVVANPLLTIITPISYDHTDYLGNSLQLIAREKAGIIKKGTPCIIGAQQAEVYESLCNMCDGIGSPSFSYGYDFIAHKNMLNGFTYSSRTAGDYMLPSPSLPGDHQLINAATATAAVGIINAHFNINMHQISQGLKSAYWPARLQRIAASKYAHLINDSNNIHIWLDGAHNAHGAQIVASWAKQNLTTAVHLILGMTKGRSIEDFCTPFKDVIVSGYGVRVLSEVASYSAEDIAKQAIKSGLNFKPIDSLTEAIQAVDRGYSKNSSNNGINIIICGSLFLAADCLKLMQ